MQVRQAVWWRVARSAMVATAVLSANASPATAATATAPIVVTATVLSLCTLVATPLVFGNYSSGTVDATATISVLCTASTTYDIGLDQGGGVSASVSARKMSSGGTSLNYALYRDPSRSVNWGNTPGTDTLAGVGSGLPQVLTVYGRIASGQYVAPGAYLDTITATITY